MSGLRDYTDSAAKWITIVESEFYPESLETAVPLYEPVLKRFRDVLVSSKDSKELLKRISDVSAPLLRRQLLRVFRKYVSPDTSVEMLKRKRKIPEICREFGSRFRDIADVRERFDKRPERDEALIALLNEYRDRGQKGYTLSGYFFEWFETNLGTELEIYGPSGAGKDINLGDWLPGYPKERRPIDFIITKRDSTDPLVIGLLRYDSDRGGAQEDDRVSGYRNVVGEVLGYGEETGLRLKLLFINDGPGLLLGSMWKDYCEIEEIDPSRVLVATVKMLPERLTAEWIGG